MLSVVVTALTDNANTIPTVVLLGSFLVPVTAVVWYLDHYERRTISVRLVLEALLVGGVLGVLAASVLESWLLRDGLLAYLGVGLVEELAKLLALMFVARRLTRYTIRDGVVLGAAVGFGFAALESSGYALTALVVRAGPFVELSLGNLVLTELLRGLLAPVGHGLWTAILGGVLFSSSLLGKLRVTGQVVAAYSLGRGAARALGLDARHRHRDHGRPHRDALAADRHRPGRARAADEGAGLHVRVRGARRPHAHLDCGLPLALAHLAQRCRRDTDRASPRSAATEAASRACAAHPHRRARRSALTRWTPSGSDPAG